jgi:hypothetical protein
VATESAPPLEIAAPEPSLDPGSLEVSIAAMR